jgi:malonyl-CoA/methylmalonyl-CoA synthetase
VNANLYSLFQARFPTPLTAPFLETQAGARYSYADLDDTSARLAGFLSSLGLRRGDRVAVQAGKSPELLFLYLACLRAGLAYLPLNPAYQARELNYFLGDAAPAVVIGSAASLAILSRLAARHRIRHLYTLEADGTGSLIERSADAPPSAPIAPTDGRDIAAILYTSGTTGSPKGAVLSHRNLAANALALHQAWGWRPDDVLLHILPLFHVHGLFTACHCVLLNGTGMVFLDRPNSDLILEHLPPGGAGDEKRWRRRPNRA